MNKLLTYFTLFASEAFNVGSPHLSIVHQIDPLSATRYLAPAYRCRFALELLPFVSHAEVAKSAFVSKVHLDADDSVQQSEGGAV